MAGVLRAQNTNTNFTTKDDLSKENVRPKATRGGASKRTAFGNVTNQLRRQPQRLAKGKHTLQGSRGQENDDAALAAKGGKSFPSFAIFEDTAGPSNRTGPHVQHDHDNEPMQDQENIIPGGDLVLNDAVANLTRGGVPHRHLPLAPLDLDLSTHMSEASPMFMDESRRQSDVSIIRSDEFGLDPYFQDIYAYMRVKERGSRPRKDYMARQTDVTTSMRNILVDWLVEVGEEYKLHRETLFLAVSYIDRFLSLVSVSRSKLQLVGTTCMFIASKYEEIYPPEVAEFVYITDDTYTRNQVLKMESAILKILDFKVTVPTINWFAERFLSLLEMSDRAKFLTFLLAELSLIEIEKFLDYCPSVIAASCIVIARSILQTMDKPWPKHMEQSSGYALSDLQPCISLLFSQYTRRNEMVQKAVVEKYKQHKFAQVSTIEAPLTLRLF